MTEEVCKKEVKRSSRSKKSFIALEQKNFKDDNWDLGEAREKSLTENGRIEEVSEFYLRHNC